MGNNSNINDFVPILSDANSLTRITPSHKTSPTSYEVVSDVFLYEYEKSSHQPPGMQCPLRFDGYPEDEAAEAI